MWKIQKRVEACLIYGALPKHHMRGHERLWIQPGQMDPSWHLQAEKEKAREISQAECRSDRLEEHAWNLAFHPQVPG